MCHTSRSSSTEQREGPAAAAGAGTQPALSSHRVGRALLLLCEGRPLRFTMRALPAGTPFVDWRAGLRI